MERRKPRGARREVYNLSTFVCQLQEPGLKRRQVMQPQSPLRPKGLPLRVERPAFPSLLALLDLAE